MAATVRCVVCKKLRGNTLPGLQCGDIGECVVTLRLLSIRRSQRPQELRFIDRL
jgi:hypothetical protein